MIAPLVISNFYLTRISSNSVVISGLEKSKGYLSIIISVFTQPSCQVKNARCLIATTLKNQLHKFLRKIQNWLALRQLKWLESS